MSVPTPSLVLDLGPARLCLEPPAPPVWLSLAGRAPGPASLCLALLPLAGLAWEGVAMPGGTAACPGPAAWAALPAGLLPRLLPALCPPWLSAGEEAELNDLERYLRARADFPGLDCAACREQQEQGEGAPDCLACPRPFPPASARVALGLFPLLGAWPQGFVPGAGAWPTGLPAREAWLLAWRLALVGRWQGRGAGPGCPVLGGDASM